MIKVKTWEQAFGDTCHLSQHDPQLVASVNLAEVNVYPGFSAVCQTAATVCYDRGHG